MNIKGKCLHTLESIDGQFLYRVETEDDHAQAN